MTRRMRSVLGSLLLLGAAACGDEAPPAMSACPHSCGDDPSPYETGDCEEQPATLRLRRLSQTEYRNAVQDLFGVDPEVAASLPGAGLEPGRETPPATLLEVDVYRRVAEEIAPLAAPALESDIDCEPEDRACVAEALAPLVRRVLRSPADPVHEDRFAQLYHVAGAEGVIALLLQSPQFLYVVERGEPSDDASSGPRRLTSWELATRLSLFLWQSVPDPPLLEAAAQGELSHPDGLRRQIERMIADPRTATMLRRELRRWAAPELETLNKSATAFPEFSTAMRTAMIEQMDRLVDDVLARGGGLAELLSTARTPVSRSIAELYGISVTAEAQEEEEETWDVFEVASPRFGILTLPGFLASRARSDESSPVYRGEFIREALLCQDLASPPPGIEPVVPSPNGDETNRQRYEQHATDPVCAGCHRLMDPLGFAFEHYDGLGRFRTEQGGQAIDSSGELTATSQDGQFSGPEELVTMLIAHPDVHRCWVKGWVARALGETAADAEPLRDEVLDTLDISQAPLVELLEAIVLSERFATVTPAPED